MSEPRRLAFDVLMQVERGAFADAALSRALDRARLSDEDRGLATRLVYGVLAWQLRLDHTIDAHARRPPSDPKVRIALRIGLFQIAYLERIPDYAAVDTTVDLVRELAPHAAGFANAVLRRATRSGLGELPTSEPERTAVALSHPRWLVEMWTDELGRREAEALMTANNEPMPTVLRALGERDAVIAALRQRGLNPMPARFAPDGISGVSPQAASGLAIAQGEASQLVALLLGAGAGMRVLDACAAPGGKTAYLANLVAEHGTVLAVDRAARARERIEATCSAAGVRNVEIVAGAIEEVGDDLGEFDVVLVDTPCSGLGTLREHPEIRWRRGPKDIENLAVRQATILAAASRRVRAGGTLVYSTCTIAKVENEEIVERFVCEHGDFVLDTTPVHPAVAPFLDADGIFRTWPHRHDTAGFFAARLVRRDASRAR